MSSRMELLKKKESQLKARIEREKALIRTRANKEKTSKLIAWGTVIESKLASGELLPKEWAEQCKKYLDGYRLNHALTGALAPFAVPVNSSKAEVTQAPEVVENELKPIHAEIEKEPEMPSEPPVKKSSKPKKGKSTKSLNGKNATPRQMKI